jgi:two-component system, LytTR family, response regulator
VDDAKKIDMCTILHTTPGATAVAIPTCRGLVLVPLNEIIRIEGRSNYSRIYFAGKIYPLTVARVLKWFEAELPPGSFIRPHRTHLVNAGFVKTVHREGKQNWLLLHNGEHIAVSRRKKTAVRLITAV